MKILKLVVVAFIVSLLLQFRGLAQSEHFVINNFRSHIRLSQDRSAIVNERIDLTFTSPRHGIFRHIPNRFSADGFGPDIETAVEVIKVVDESGNRYQYETYTENDNLVVKIGDPNLKVSGEKTYSITYEIENIIKFFEAGEEFVWDINGTGWGTSIEQLSAEVVWPDGEAPVQVGCFSGFAGSTDTNCLYDSLDQSTRFSSTEPLSANQNVTLALQFESGTFIAPTFWDTWGWFLLINSGALLPLPVFIIVYRKWQKYGKDPKGRGVITTQFDAPNKLSPAEAGTIVDYRVDQVELSATLIDLAIRGYLQIVRTGKGKQDYTFKLLNPNTQKLKAHEVQLLKGLFTAFEKNSETKLKSLKNKFYTTSESVKKDLVSELTSGGYFKKNPTKVMGAWIAVGVAVMIGGVYSLAAIFGPLGAWLSGLGVILSGLLVLIFGFFMPARTIKGVAAYEHVLGLKNYLQVAESTRLSMMQGPDSRYVGDTTAPKYTVELFEKLLPYAIVLKAEKQWAKKFKDIYNQPPGWYTGHHYAAFNSAVLASDLGAASKAISNTMISRPSSSSGSSFSGGGGFSGGGFGGGGGGSW